MTEEVHRLNHLSDSQRSGAISLVFKKEDRLNLKYYRPISLLNVDVKSITKMLAIRLFKVLPTIINSDETCVPGRNIALNTHTLYDVIKYAKSKNIQAAILFIDQENAINRVDHSFLIKTLEHLNLGNSFVTWFKILMKNITSQVKINGFLTEPFSMTRGIKQGDPLRALLYVIISEILGNQIRSSDRIKGVRVGNSKKKIMQYVDDTELFVTDDESINQILFELKRYETATRAKVNVEKQRAYGLVHGKEDKIGLTTVNGQVIRLKC